MPAHHPAPLPDFLYGTAWKQDRTQTLTELALRMGFRGIDTANQRRHYFEAGVGQALAAAYGAGVVTRADLFLQTKFTYQHGQDHRLPYDPAADLATQVAQSLASSLEHLGTDHVDSYVLHGPASGHGWSDNDAEVWAAMAKERDAGRTRFLGVSNVGLWHLEEMAATGAEVPRCGRSNRWPADCASALIGDLLRCRTPPSQVARPSSRGWWSAPCGSRWRLRPASTFRSRSSSSRCWRSSAGRAAPPRRRSRSRRSCRGRSRPWWGSWWTAWGHAGSCSAARAYSAARASCRARSDHSGRSTW